MSRLIESIRLDDGRFCNLRYHEDRMVRSLAEAFGLTAPVRLERTLRGLSYPTQGLYKCRLLYNSTSIQVAFVPYERRHIRRLKIVEDEGIRYDHKFEDREGINRLFGARGDCDDVLIVKGGKVTDCSFSNIVFRSGNQWFTPASPLLPGTTRQRLIDERVIQPLEIRKDDIRSFDTFKLINAMLQFDSDEIEVSAIVF